MKTFVNPSREKWAELCQRPQIESGRLGNSVRTILDAVRQNGDRALKELTLEYDKTTIERVDVSPEEIRKATDSLPDGLKEAINTAAANIEKFHKSQKRELVTVETMPGVTCWRKGVAIDKVGIYIPGGSAPLFSTVLMLGIPARIAGCREVVLCTPPDKKGEINAAILYAAQLVGITKIYKVGGAQAIAAMAYGTQTIPAVYKIFGPGNQYVTKAKQLVSEEGVAIDMPAGPSEVLVMADENADTSFVAADLLSQAEHGEDSQVMLVVNKAASVPDIQQAIEAQLGSLPRKAIAEQSLLNSRVVIFDQEQNAIDFINEYAPEHLIINTENADKIAGMVINAGSVFIGSYTPESAGDYASGTNHTLPTNGYARAFAGVSLESFIKYITFQKISPDGLRNVGPVIERMAEAEMLEAHKMAVTIRLKSLNP